MPPSISRKLGLKTVLVSNGYINEEPFRELAPLIDAMNIDVKSMNPEFYPDVCKGSLADVLRTVEIAASSGMLVEVTNLVITGLNDNDNDCRRWSTGSPELIARFRCTSRAISRNTKWIGR